MISVGETTKVDLEAVEAVRNWGISAAVIRVPPAPCSRPDCGGSVLTFDGERLCILCARSRDDYEVLPFVRGFAR